MTDRESRNGQFRSKNTLQSTERPNFGNPLHPQDHNQSSTAHSWLLSSRTDSSLYELPKFRRPIPPEASPSFSEHYQPSPTAIGNSSSLFDENSLASLDIRHNKHTPPAHLFGPVSPTVGTSINLESPILSDNMVNERSPAKAPLQPTKANEQSTQPSQIVLPPKPVQNMSAPRFGETSLPQSPLNRKTVESHPALLPRQPQSGNHSQPPNTTSMLRSH